MLRILKGHIASEISCIGTCGLYLILIKTKLKIYGAYNFCLLYSTWVSLWFLCLCSPLSSPQKNVFWGLFIYWTALSRDFLCLNIALRHKLSIKKRLLDSVPEIRKSNKTATTTYRPAHGSPLFPQPISYSESCSGEKYPELLSRALPWTSLSWALWM